MGISASASPCRVWVIAAPGLGVDDLRAPELAPLRDLADLGACGWVNTRAGILSGQEVESDAASWATMGAGARAAAPDSAAVVDLRTARTVAAATRLLDHPVHVGQLGDLLSRAGVAVTIAGDADTEQAHREAGWLACRHDGSVDEWREAGRAEPEAAWGREADLEPLTPRPSERFVLSIFGDLARAQSESPLCRAPQREAVRARARRQFAKLCTAARAWVQDGADRRLLLVSVATSEQIRDGNRLAPVLVAGAGYRGRIHSASTRTAGLASSVDVLPTVASWLELGRPVAYGRAMVGETRAGNSPEWSSMWREWHQMTVLKSTVGGFPIITATLLLALAALPAGWRRFRVAVAAALVALPVGQVLGALLGPIPLPRAVAVLISFVVGYVGLSAALGRRARALVAVTLLGLVLALVIDLAGAQVLSRGSWLGYSVMEASRYYGIGNETAAILIAGAIVLAGVRPRAGLAAEALLITLLVILTFVLGAPWMGAALGEVLAAGIVFTYLVGARLGLGGWRTVMVAGVITAALLIGTVLLDQVRGGGSSHIAMAFANRSILAATIIRKVMINLHLVATSPWTVAGLAAAVCWRSVAVRLVATDIARGLRAVAIGSAALLVLNDSGMMAGALSLAFGTACLVVLGECGLLDKGPVQEHTDRHKAPGQSVSHA